MNNDKLINKCKVFEGGAKYAVTGPDTYIYALIGGVARGMVTKSISKGITYGLFAVGFQVLWNGVWHAALWNTPWDGRK